MTASHRILVTAEAADLIRRLREEHGPLMFHQSGGCCDGSSPMCYPATEFLVGDRDILLGIVLVERDMPTPVWISGPQFEAWRHTQLVLDVVPGRGGGFFRWNLPWASGSLLVDGCSPKRNWPHSRQRRHLPVPRWRQAPDPQNRTARQLSRLQIWLISARSQVWARSRAASRT
jgi:uncharacterized protein (DUF779 family)